MRSFRCNCGRVQRYADEGTPGGVTIPEAKAAGWTFDGEKWICPLCSRSGTPGTAVRIPAGYSSGRGIIPAADLVK